MPGSILSAIAPLLMLLMLPKADGFSAKTLLSEGAPQAHLTPPSSCLAEYLCYLRLGRPLLLSRMRLACRCGTQRSALNIRACYALYGVLNIVYTHTIVRPPGGKLTKSHHASVHYVGYAQCPSPLCSKEVYNCINLLPWYQNSTRIIRTQAAATFLIYTHLLVKRVHGSAVS